MEVTRKWYEWRRRPADVDVFTTGGGYVDPMVLRPDTPPARVGVIQNVTEWLVPAIFLRWPSCEFYQADH